MFYGLLRAAMNGDHFTAPLTDDAWRAVFAEAHRQSLVGVLWTVAQHQQLPMEVALPWASEAETIRGLNALLNSEAARLTELFEREGRQTAILKGQANARLYPDPLSRQPGDIDIWVSGGKQLVTELVERCLPSKREPTTSYHHIHLPTNERGVDVEVHFRPASGNFNPLTNRRLQRWLEQEIQHTTKVAEGFNVPTMAFALAMQLAHVQRHFLGSGVGLRHVCDYYRLLCLSTEDDRSQLAASLAPFGLKHVGGALMWVLQQVLGLDDRLLLCQPDSRRGEWMLREIMAGGNFGYHALRMQYGVWRRVAEGRLRHLQLMRFDFGEMAWLEANYWKTIVETLPTRIRYRTLSLKDIPR